MDGATLPHNAPRLWGRFLSLCKNYIGIPNAYYSTISLMLYKP